MELDTQKFTNEQIVKCLGEITKTIHYLGLAIDALDKRIIDLEKLKENNKNG